MDSRHDGLFQSLEVHYNETTCYHVYFFDKCTGCNNASFTLAHFTTHFLRRSDTFHSRV